ncbi:aminoglycoside phosphotransferase family protein [Saccharibacillus sacchari]|uniref:Aminoglycoside phosphotransferase family protein n=1 Tax=Saccharibacillus sacchari TaxID=456493 RepID=A0ACC6P7C5_9BACL
MSNPFAQRLQEVYPAMAIEDIQTERAAQHYVVLGINYKLVFRFARNEYRANRLAYEARTLLPTVSRAANLPVPVPLYESLERLEPVLAFIGYERIDGEPLWPEIVESLAGTEEETRLADRIGGFLQSLHTVQLEADLPEPEESEELQQLSDERLKDVMRRQLFPVMSKTLQAQAEIDLEAWAESEKKSAKMLIHGAFGPAHLLWDAEYEQLAGVIGFGSARLGDPAIDFAGILSGYGSSFFEKCLAAYGGDAGLADRARLYAKILLLREALYGAEEGDADVLAYGLEAYATSHSG